MKITQDKAASEAAKLLRAIPSERRAETSRQNGKTGGRPKGTVKPLLKIPCTCNGGETLTAEAHPTTCPRGRAIRYRQKNGLPLT